MKNKKILGSKKKNILVESKADLQWTGLQLDPILLCNLDSFSPCFGVLTLILPVLHNTQQKKLLFIFGY